MTPSLQEGAPDVANALPRVPVQVMHVSVTALGAEADRTGSAARDIVSYLEGQAQNRLSLGGSAAVQPPSLATGSSPGAYYADSAVVPGRWRGDGADGLGPCVESSILKRVLLGQDPVSGTQLVSAVGSSGRTSQRPSMPDGDENELLTLPQAAKLIGVDRSYLWRIAKRTAADHAAASPTVPEGSPTAPTGSPTGRPSGTYLSAEKVDGRWMVSQGEVARFMAARRQPQVVMAYDVTFSAPKSLSIVWATGDDATRRLCENAFEAGVARGVEYLERNAVWVRRGRDSVPAGEMIAASYRHSTNRELEPQLHEHVVIANMGTGRDGRVQALDGRGLFAHATTAGHVAEAEMQHACNRAGIAWGPTRRGIADVEGVGRDAIRAVSTRREQILSLTAELGSDSAKARQIAALATRAAKDTSVDLDELRHSWQERLADAGFGPTELQVATTADPVRLWTPEDSARLDRHLAGPVGVTEQRAVFDRRDVIQTVVDHAGGRLSGDEVIEHSDRWLRSDAVIPLTADHQPGPAGSTENQLFTTPTMIRIEKAIADGHVRGHDQGAGIVPAVVIDAEIRRWETATGHVLGDDQRAMVHSICGSGDRFQAVVGPAGSGKTAALEVAARAWEAAGYKVVGAAVNGTAAEVLQRSTGVESRTVAGLVTRLDTATDRVLDDRTVVLVDEASTLGNRPHARLVHHVETSGAVMRAIGDPAQHSAVEAGGMWAQMVDQHPDRVPALTENRRQAAEEMADVRLANSEYRAGRIAEAIDRLEAGDRIVTAPTSSELLDQVATDWYVDHKVDPASSCRMIAEHHRERRALNQRAQALLRADGSIEPDGVEIGEALFHVGDQVIARAPNRNLYPADDPKAYVRNGTPGTVTAIEKRRGQPLLVVDFKHRGPITVPHAWLTTELRPGICGGLTPAYAVTSHAAQGDTYRTGRMVATDTAKTEAVYVGLTRGTHDTRIYTVAAEPKSIDTDPKLPRIEDDRTEIEALRDQLTKPSHPETATGIAADIDATLAQLHRPLVELEAATDPASQQAAKIVAARITHTARAEPDPALVARVGTRAEHTDPAVWDRAVDAHALASARGHASNEGAELAVRAGEASLMSNQPVSELAARRGQLIAAARSIPGHSVRLARQDHQAAIDAVADARKAVNVAQAAHRDESSKRARRRNPDRVELTRRDLDTATRSLDIATHRLHAARERLTAATTGRDRAGSIERQVDVIDRALAPSIDNAVAHPANYLADTLGPQPASGNQAWTRAATTIETYRHATLGLIPADGPADPSAAIPAIGPRPHDPVAAEVWPGVARLIEGLTHGQTPTGPGIER